MKHIAPDSLRGRLLVKILQVIRDDRADPQLLHSEAPKQGLTRDQLLAACITEAVLEIVQPKEPT